MHPSDPLDEATRPQSLLESRDGRALLTTHACYAFARGALSFGAPWIALDRGASVFVASVLGTVGFIGFVIASIPAGIGADRGSRRRLLRMVTACCAMTVAALVAVSELADGLLVPALGIASIIFGGAGSLLLASSYPAAAELVGGDGVRGAHAKLNTLDQISSFGAASLGALLVGVGGTAGLLFPLLALCLLASAATWRIEDPLLAPPSDREGGIPLESVLFGAGPIRRLLFLGGAWNLAVGAFLALEIAWLYDRLSVSAETAGIILALGAVGSLASGWLLTRGWVRLPLERMLPLAMLGQALMMVLAVSVPVVLCGPLLLVLMLCNSTAASAFVTLRHERAPSGRRSSVLAVGQLVHRACFFGATLLWSALVPLIGFTGVFLAGSGLLVGLAVVAGTVRVASDLG